MERALYVAPFIAIQPDNRGDRVKDLVTLRAAVACGRSASAGARLAPALGAADVDADTAALGDAAVRALLEWCVARGLPYLLRESGRPGGRHVITIFDSPETAAEWRQLCVDLAERLGTVVDDRTGQVLRLLSAPHRRGLPSRIVVNTITPAAIAAAAAAWDVRVRKSKASQPSRACRRARSRAGNSRSEGEFGLACALARNGYDTASAWAEVSTKGSKAHDRGKHWWCRYAWLPAVTLVAAEEGSTEQSAWARAKNACPEIGRNLPQWQEMWRQALTEAKMERPRRRRLKPAPAVPADHTESPEVLTLEAGLRAAVQGLTDLETRRRKSLSTVLCALAMPLITREGSISLRDLSVRSRLALATVRRALASAIDLGLLEISRAYTGGADDCHAYRIGPAASSYITRAQDYEHTSLDTPRPLGRCSPTRLVAQYTRARVYWRARCDALAALAPGERLADSHHPAAKLIRSLWFQRRWWANLPVHEQEKRRTARREVLRQLHPSERKAWFRWLDRRHDITAAVDRILVHTETPEDSGIVLNAPLTIHHGMRDPQWRAGGTPLATRRTGEVEQPELCVA
ncbi:hypothetical protein ACWDO0_34535 [Nocardia rhamnosiphila]